MFKNVSWKSIEAAREIRMWIGQIVAPIAGVLVLSPEARDFLKGKLAQAKDMVKNLIH